MILGSDYTADNSRVKFSLPNDMKEMVLQTSHSTHPKSNKLSGENSAHDFIENFLSKPISATGAYPAKFLANRKAVDSRITEDWLNLFVPATS